MTDRRTKTLITFATWIVSVLLFSTAHSLWAQVPMRANDNKSAVNLSDFERINLRDGRLGFSLSIATLSGRGMGNGVSLNIQHAWRTDDVITGYSGGIPNVTQIVQADTYSQTGLYPSAGGRLEFASSVANTIDINNCLGGTTQYFAVDRAITVTFNGFNGQGLNFIAEQNDGAKVTFTGQGCTALTYNLGSVFVATDGSGTKFISDGSGVLVSSELVDDPTGFRYPSGVLKFPNGTTARVDSGTVGSLEDSNGNITTMAGGPGVTSVKDALNREITTSGTSNYLDVTYTGFAGNARSTRVTYCNGSSSCLRSGQSFQYMNQLFPWLGPYYPNNNLVVSDGVKEVELPNGKKYKFFYNSYNELARVELPTGGAVEYDYESSQSTTRRLIERRVYTDGSNLDNKTVYEFSDATTEKVYDNQNHLKSVTKHYFVGCLNTTGCYTTGTWYQSGTDVGDLAQREWLTEVYDSDGTTLMRKTESSFEPRRRLAGGTGAYVDFRVVSVTNTLADSNQVSNVTYGYDYYAAYNLQTDVYEYDYGAGQPGALLRRTHTDYETGAAYTSNSVRILDLPIAKWVNAETSPYNKVSFTTFEYDNYTTDATHAPLVNRSSITGHNSSKGTGYSTRGNLTRTTGYTSASTATGAVYSYSQYDIAGNVVKTIDPNGNASTIDYCDRYGSPDDEAQSNSAPSFLNNVPTYAFATSATNAVGWTTYAQRDFYTGGVVDSEDINGNITTTSYDDPLDRPKQTINNNNRSTLKTQTTVAYDDTNKKVTVTADSKAYNDNAIKSEAYYDGFGRTTESRDYENASEYVTTKSEYDSLGRAFRTCNPYRPYLSETAQWTTSAFDSLGRVTSTTTADNAVASRTFYGSAVQVTDQAGRSRAGLSDGIGRLKQVTEYDNGTQYESYYTYDILGRLRRTAQTSGSTTQNRYFMYDDLGRLIRARQVEQGTNSSLNLTDPVTGNTSWSVAYVYDNNGNITSTTDALNRQITGTYDTLNRLTFRNYSDSAPDVTFTYDDVNIANSKGKLTSVSSSLSATNYSAFDLLGRIKSSSQTTGGQNYTFSDYTYDLSGALVSQSYPSGRVVTTETDTIGRLSDVKSQLPNDVQKTMLSQLAYTSFGAVKQAKLGNGKWESAVFDSIRLQVTQVGLGSSAGDTSLLKLEYSYGGTSNNGALLQQKITIPGTTQVIQNYAYDYLNRLQSATEAVSSVETWKQEFTYDRFGNKNFVTGPGHTTTLGSCSQQSCNPGYDQAKNQFLTSDGYTYDAEGNITGSSYDSRTFSYDSENRLIQTQNTSTEVTGTYQYDGQGKRVKKSVDGQDTYFVYDAFGKLTAEYTVNQAITQEGTQYLTADALGSPRVITDAIGQVQSRHDYMPFGEEVGSGVGGRTTVQGYAQPDNARQKFTGYERDGESGLDFAQNRYFSSKNGRFTSVDPLAASASIKAPQTLNRYSYGNNSPYKFTDGLGLEPCGVSAGGSNGRACTQADDDDGDDKKRKKKTPIIMVPIDAPVCRGCEFIQASVTVFAQDAVETASQAEIDAVFAQLVREISPRPLLPLVGPIVGVPITILTAVPPGGSPCQVASGDEFCGQKPEPQFSPQTDIQPDIGRDPGTATGPPDNSGPVYVRFGEGPEGLQKLSGEAENAAANPRYGYGVSVRLYNRPPPHGRSAPIATAHAAFKIRQTGGDPRHFTVFFPRPLTQETVNLFNSTFR